MPGHLSDDELGGTGFSGTDYADFEYDHVTAIHKFEPSNFSGTGSPRTLAHFEWDPLQGVGGLSGNEVAELVYFNQLTIMEHDEDPETTNSQSSNTYVEYRGVFGANISANFDKYGLSASGSQANIESERAVTKENAQQDPGGLDTQGRIITDDRLMNIFKLEDALTFKDTGSSTGGGGSQTPYQTERNLRDLVGRGPVLYDDDTLGLNSALVLGDPQIPVLAETRMQFVWDIAEVDESGREFSVPDGM